MNAHSYHACRIIMISMNGKDRQTNIEVRIFIIHMTKPVHPKKTQVSFFAIAVKNHNYPFATKAQSQIHQHKFSSSKEHDTL